jgi:hypothetical protein
MKCESLFPIREGELMVTADFRNVIVVHHHGNYADFLTAYPTKTYLALEQIPDHRILSYVRSSSRLRLLSVFPHKRKQDSKTNHLLCGRKIELIERGTGDSDACLETRTLVEDEVNRAGV